MISFFTQYLYLHHNFDSYVNCLAFPSSQMYRPI